MADIPGDQMRASTVARRRRLAPWLLRLLPGSLAALVFLALAAGDLLGGAAWAIRATLALALVASVAAQPPVARALARAASHPARWHALALVGVGALALWLRLWGLRFGLPYFEHPDEWAVADRAIRMVQTGDYSPHSFVYPTLYTYLQMGVAALHFLWGVSAGVYQTLADIEPARFYPWGRALTALLGTGAVVCTYAAGRLVYGRPVGLLAAALLAVHPAAVADAHYITTDTPAMFFTTLASLPIAWLGLRAPVAARERQALALIAGFAAGLAVAAKYNAAVLALPLLLACAYADHGSRFAFQALLALLGMGLGFTLGTPAWLRELPRMLDDIASVIVHYKFKGHPGAESDHPALFYWNELLRTGWLLAWAALGGALLAFARRNRAELLALSFAVPAFLQLTSFKVVFFRNAMPLLPFLCVFAAVLVWVALTPRPPLPLRGERGRKEGETSATLPQGRLAWREALLALAVVALAAQPLAQSVRDDWLRAQPTTRILATEWVEQRAPDGARIWLEDQTLILPPRLRVQGGAPVTSREPAWYRENGFRYLVVHEGADRDDRAQLARFGAPAARFAAEGQRHGSTFAIYDTGVGDPEREPRTRSGATLGNGAIVLDGYRHPGVAQPGTTLPLALFWRATRPLPADYTVYVHLRDASGATVAQRDLPPLDGALPTSRWQQGALIRDDQDLPLPPELAPGRYRLVVGMYDPQSMAAINDAGPIEVGDVIVRPRPGAE